MKEANLIEPPRDHDLVGELLEKGEHGMTKEQALRRGLIPMTRQELEALETMGTVERLEFLQKKAQAFGNDQKRINREVTAEMKIHPLGNVNDEDRAAERNRRKRSRRNRAAGR